MKWGGRLLSVYNAFAINEDYRNGAIETESMITDQFSNLYSVMGGIEGAAWGIGWEAGRNITTIDIFQEIKFNYWYNCMENRIGSPSIANEGAWYEYFQNYK